MNATCFWFHQRQTTTIIRQAHAVWKTKAAKDKHYSLCTFICAEEWHKSICTGIPDALFKKDRPSSHWGQKHGSREESALDHTGRGCETSFSVTSVAVPTESHWKYNVFPTAFETESYECLKLQVHAPSAGCESSKINVYAIKVTSHCIDFLCLPRFCMKAKRSSKNSFLLGSLSSSYSCKEKWKVIGKAAGSRAARRLYFSLLQFSVYGPTKEVRNF